MRLAADAALDGSESFGSPGVAYVKWPNPVRPGAALSLKAEVIETRLSLSQPVLGDGGFSISLASRRSRSRRRACSTSARLLKMQYNAYICKGVCSFAI